MCLAPILIVAGPVCHELLLLPTSLEFIVISLQCNFKTLDSQCCFHRELAVFGQRAITSSARNNVLFVSFCLQAFVSAFEDVRNLLYDVLAFWDSSLPMLFFFSIKSA